VSELDSTLHSIFRHAGFEHIDSNKTQAEHLCSKCSKTCLQNLHVFPSRPFVRPRRSPVRVEPCVYCSVGAVKMLAWDDGCSIEVIPLLQLLLAKV